ncbi:MAG: hypothetical protein LBT64_02010 [Puniceicoccales bacterium]|jgi:phosphoglucosamine mutase|nr:hypothetical protein [Puniceicoccales bacterium]
MKYFGTDGIRGKFGEFPIVEQFFRDLARAVEIFFAEENAENLTICVGRDTRSSGDILLDALLRGFSGTAKVLDCGIFPTPAISLATLASGADVGIAITASHNPGHHNGIKIFSGTGEKLTPVQEAEIERLLKRPSALKRSKKLPPTKAEMVDFRAAAKKIYAATYENFLPKCALSGKNIVLDMANGATCTVAEEIFRNFGANVVPLGNSPDGKNINGGCGSEHPENLMEFVKRGEAFAGIAYDGDGDRMIMCDEMGEKINGDVILGSVARHMSESGELENGKIVVTTQSNLGLDMYLKTIGISVIRCDVGDRNVQRTMLQNDCAFGGENSGHLIFKKFSSVGDGLGASLYVLSLAAKENIKLSELKTKIALLPQKSFNVTVARNVPIDKIPHLGSDIEKTKAKLPPPSRVEVRNSGTESMLRVLVEASDSNSVDDAWSDLKKSIIVRVTESGIDASIS